MAALESTTRLISLRQFLQPWVPTATSIRWRTRKPNIQRPIPDHYVKAKYKNALQPIYPEPLVGKPWFEACGNLLMTKKTEELSKYEELLAKEFYSNFSSSQVIGIFQENPTKSIEKMRLKEMFHGHGMKMITASKPIITKAIAGTLYEPVLQLHMGNTSYLCMEKLQIDKLLKFSKKMPSYILLGGVVQGRLITKSQLQWCSTLPDINILRAELCSILSSASMHLSKSLVYHQQALAGSLEQHLKQSQITGESTSS